MTILDTELKSKFLTVICDTIVNNKNRNDFIVLVDELATACTIYTQTNLLSNKCDLSSSVVSRLATTDSKTESVKKTNPANIQHREKVNLTEKLGVSETENVITTTQKDLQLIDRKQKTPVWTSEKINWAEYWVYDYSTPCTTKHGNCGGECAQTEIWLVHRRKYKLNIVDAEFASVDALHGFLNPRKELAAKNRIVPLEQIDAELAGTEEKQRAECRAAKKQSQFNRFLEFYHQFNGDAAKVSAAMGIKKQTVYAYKNKAKDMGVLK